MLAFLFKNDDAIDVADDARKGLPENLAEVLDAIEAVGLQTSEVSRFIPGTTRITNAIVEERLPQVALVATRGFEDVLEIGRYRRRDLYRLDIAPKAKSLVPREFCFGLHERFDHDGAVITALIFAFIVFSAETVSV